MKVIIAGGRTFEPKSEHKKWLKETLTKLGATEIVCGMAKGADMFGFQVAKEMYIPVKEFPANWYLFGKKAGYLRNEEMAQYADACVLFPGGKGTALMEILAKRYEIPVIKWEEICS